MAELEDKRRESMAQLLARGWKKARAYREAGFAPDRGNACRVANESSMLARVAELRAQLPVEAEVLPPEVEAVRGGKVTRESMTQDIDRRIAMAEQQGEWPTVAALTATRAKLHGLLLQEQAAAEGGAQLSDAALLAKIMQGVKATGAGIEPWRLMRLMGMRDANGNIAGPLSPVPNGHTKRA
jgi:hypothetical protein